MKKLPSSNGDMHETGFRLIIYLQILLPWTAAFLIWGIAFSHIVLITIIGAIIGLFGCIMTYAALKNARTIEQYKERVYASGALWLGPAMAVLFLGIIVLVIKLIFFR